MIDPAKPDEKGEGAFYIWTQDEIEAAGAVSPRRRGSATATAWRRTATCANDPHGEFTGKNILFQAHTVEETAQHFGKPAEEVRHALEAAGGKLLAARSQRVRPHLDDKVLTAWNGLMISAFAKGGAVLAEPRYADAAARAAEFILSRMYDAKTGMLLRRYRQRRSGDRRLPGRLCVVHAGAAGSLRSAVRYCAVSNWRVQLTEKQTRAFRRHRSTAGSSARPRAMPAW